MTVNTMSARLKLSEGVTWVGESGSGHAIVIDGSPEIGGRNLGMRPMELILLGVGSCSAMDVMLILRKARQDVSDCCVEIQGTRAETIPQVFTAIHLHFIIEGRELAERHVARAVQLSAEKYCSASLMLQASVEITHDFEIRPL